MGIKLFKIKLIEIPMADSIKKVSVTPIDDEPNRVTVDPDPEILGKANRTHEMDEKLRKIMQQAQDPMRAVKYIIEKEDDLGTMKIRATIEKRIKAPNIRICFEGEAIGSELRELIKSMINMLNEIE